ncbi:chondroitin sulfate synthase 1 isoform X2 [Coccinella septempunctata]|uniref:chondroitin sulfate synthase 1 isoform X2 n=1 Tax=Coccinella septempunctata TaxID=41139 RepID=UPI001D0757BB|nr:chondroitin sulfate synthase 1 isoform X2 [Coccinella septempunctata]
MAKVKNIVRLLWGVFLGNTFCFMILLNHTTTTTKNECSTPRHQGLQPRRLTWSSNRDMNLIMVGVMTAPKYFNTRAKAVYNTWGREVPGDIMFYSSEGSRSLDIPLIALKDVDDSYPPQKKSLMMLKHMHDNYINKYEWFMRADDDVYVRPDRLEELLRSVDSRKTWFIGQTGRGNSEEFGLLSLDSDENFCMGGPGVIFSRETLKRVAPFVEDCLRHLYTTHEDVELGRCVRRFAGVSCTWSYQMQVIFYHNQSGNSAFTGDLKQKEIHQAITLHPVKHSEHLYRLHNYLKGLKIQKNQHDVLNLQRDLLYSMAALGFEDHSDGEIPSMLSPHAEQKNSFWNRTDIEIPASIRRHPPESLENLSEWEFLSNSLYSTSDLNPRRRYGTSLKEGLNDAIVEVMELINHYSKQRGRLIEFKEIMYAYWRMNPIYGVEYVLDLLLVYRKYRGHKMTIPVRRHAYIQQTFTGLYIRDVEADSSIQESVPNDVSVPVHKQLQHVLLNLHKNLQPFFKFGRNEEEKLIHFILPLSGRFDVFKRFMQVYEKTCLVRQENTQLNIILYENPETPGDVESTKNLVQEMGNKYYYGRISVTFIKEKFSRGPALHFGVNNLQEQDLMLFIDVDMVFNEDTLARIRKNTVANKSVYFPIVFSLYNPNILKVFRGENWWDNQDIIHENHGFWRQFGFGIVSLYKSDYLKLGGFNLLISGWGFEDVTFYDKAIKSGLHIVRSTDPNLIHVYHAIHCDPDLDNTQRQMCLGTEASTLGSLQTLQRIYSDYSHLFEPSVR